MLSRLLPKPSHFRLLPLLSSKFHPYPYFSQPPLPLSHLRFLSTDDNDNNNNNNRKDHSFSDPWKFPGESDEKLSSFFSDERRDLPGVPGRGYQSRTAAAGEVNVGGDNNRKDHSFSDPWKFPGESDEKLSSFFSDEPRDLPGVPGRGYQSRTAAAGEVNVGGGGGKVTEVKDWFVGKEDKAWNFGEEAKDDDVFGLGGDVQDLGETGGETSIALTGGIGAEERKKLEEEEKQLTAVLKGPDRAFGDLIAASGITDEMLDSLIALKDLEGVEGLPPLSVIEDKRYEKSTKKSARAEIERQKLEEMAKARVRQVDDKGRAYGTGRRKCSIARVWVQPGDGKFIINDKQFDVYFPVLDHRAALLRPFAETKTLGIWDINCTVKGGGVSGQVGAIQLGISRALQNFEPELRSPLRAAGFLTRDSRVVERKKPGKAKARKSFQWVKR